MTDWVIAELEARPIVEEVMQERLRQVEAEGWTHPHDDRHDKGELALAAACYICDGSLFDDNPIMWPWDIKWWKPNNGRRRNLIKAAALIIAEIERLDRAEHKAD